MDAEDESSDSEKMTSDSSRSKPRTDRSSGRFPSSVDAAADEVQNRIQNLLDESIDEVADQATHPSGDPVDESETHASHDKSGLTGIEAAIVARGSNALTVATALPERIGPYKVLRLLGEGGMGVVYEAQQEQPNRRVAIKLLRFGMNSPRVTARFRLEAEFLARLQHPGIARVFESGTVQVDGTERPYLVMELISGVDLLTYAQRESLSASAIIETLKRICDAVQHAHQRGVIHRDLKPSNIVVGTDGQPRILDFGIARASEDHHSLDMAITHSGEFVGTLPYMSPEQVSGKVDVIDVRSDVYSLGVIAYQLLSGALPIDVRTDSLAGAARRITDEPAPPLKPLDTSLGRDLSVVIGKAIEKLPGRRYASADAFRDDLSAVIEGRTVSARPPTALYQIQRFAGRNKALVASSFLIAGVVLTGLVVTSTLLIRARNAEALAATRLIDNEKALATAQRERDAADLARQEAEASRIEAEAQTQIANQEREEAEEQRRIAEAINNFLNNDLLSAANPDGTGSADLTVREAVNRAAERLEGRFEDDPGVAIRMNITLGRIFFQLAALEDSERVLRRAEALLLEEGDTESIALLDVRTRIANALSDQGRNDEAIALLQANIDAFRALDPEAPYSEDETSEYMLRAMAALSTVYLDEGRTADGKDILTEVHTAQRAYLGPNHGSTLTSAFNLAGAHFHLSEYETALDLYRQVYEGRTEVFGRNHPATIGSLAWVSNSLTRLNRPQEVIDLLADSIEGVRHSLGDHHPSTLQLEIALGQAYNAAGQKLAALDPLQRGFEGGLATYGPIRGPAFAASVAYATVLMDDGQAVEAIRVCSTVLDALPDPIPTRFEMTAITLLDLRGHAYRVTSQFEPAIADLQRAVALATPMIGDEHPAIVRWQESIAFSQTALQDEAAENATDP